MSKPSQEFQLQRMSGAQNTFFVANAFEPAWKKYLTDSSEIEKIALVKKVCTSYFGIQTDGVLFIEPHAGYDFAWRFYNSDGSHADMCGNASRCAAAYFNKNIKPQKKMSFLTGAGVINAEIISDSEVCVEMTVIGPSKKMQVENLEGTFVNTGVPHFVISKDANTDIAKKLRKVSDFGPEGANITFVYEATESSIKAVTFERGVEDFTRACGTGAVAAAVVAGKKKIIMPGGSLYISNASAGQRPLLRGPVQFEFLFSNWE